MLIVVASSLSVAGLAFLLRKVLVSFESVLSLSEELDPARPPVASSDIKSPGLPNTAAGFVEAAPEGDSLLRLSTAVTGMNHSYDDNPQSAPQECLADKNPGAQLARVDLKGN